MIPTTDATFADSSAVCADCEGPCEGGLCAVCSADRERTWAATRKRILSLSEAEKKAEIARCLSQIGATLRA